MECQGSDSGSRRWCRPERCGSSGGRARRGTRRTAAMRDSGSSAAGSFRASLTPAAYDRQSPSKESWSRSQRSAPGLRPNESREAIPNSRWKRSRSGATPRQGWSKLLATLTCSFLVHGDAERLPDSFLARRCGRLSGVLIAPSRPCLRLDNIVVIELTGSSRLRARGCAGADVGRARRCP